MILRKLMKRRPTVPAAREEGLTRRDLLWRFGVGLAAVPIIGLACGDDGTLGDTGADAGAGADAAPVGEGEWAVGGTSAMVDKASYPDPFTAAATACALVATTTEGPCTTSTDLDREDVSDGWSGLPVRLGLKVVDSACAPLVGVIVKIWHTNLEGVYSGQTPNPGMCSGNDQAAISANFFRGVQTTDGDGVVYFDTCFPGWYRGRAVHIHFQVKSGSTSTKVSQVFFPEDVTAAVFASHDDYKASGQPDTTFSNDNVLSGVPAASRPRHVLDVARMSDGVMLASKVVTVK